MSEALPAGQEQDPNVSWSELESALSQDLAAYVGLSWEEFLEIEEAARIGVLYTLESYGSGMTFDEIEEMLAEKGILDKYLT